MELIRIQERAGGQDGANAVVSFENGPEYSITISDPHTEKEEKELEWYFEEHLAFPFTKKVRAQSAAASITAYGEALFNQVFGNPDIYAEYRALLKSGLTDLQLEILRPGTYKALENHLRDVTAKHGEGYYHVIHFDVHGAVLTYEQFKQIQREPKDTPYQYKRYARQEIQCYEGVKAFLSFELEADNEEKDKKSDLVEASELASLLVKHHVPITVLNACQSGKQIGERETSLGSHLIQAGVQLVLAMGYSVTVSAAKLLMSTLYRRLFANDDLSIAIRHARTELYNNKERQAYFDQKIDLEDWLLPVVYQNQPITLKPREFTQEERAAWLEHKVEEKRYTPPDPQYGFVGRDIDILQIEKRLLTKRNILLVRGMGGAGKTT